MTPYNPAVFTPPSPTQVITADITSPQWRWTAGTTWRLTSSAFFGTTAPGTFKITNYSNGYYWGPGAAPLGSEVGNFTVMGSITPEGNVLFSLLADGTPNNLAGQITGDASSGIMVPSFRPSPAAPCRSTRWAKPMPRTSRSTALPPIASTSVATARC